MVVSNVVLYPRLVTLALVKAGLWRAVPVPVPVLTGMTRSRGLFIECFIAASCPSRCQGQFVNNLEMYYSSLSSSSGPVKWNHNQESSLLQDVSPFSPVYDGRSTTVTLNERIRELYLQFLWLPEVRVTIPFFFW
jgi:hypothetical protein